MRLGSLVCDLLISIIHLMVSYIFSGVWKVEHAVEYCIFMFVLFCGFFVSQSMNGEVPPPPLHSTDNSTFTFTLYFKYFLRILCTF